VCNQNIRNLDKLKEIVEDMKNYHLQVRDSDESKFLGYPYDKRINEQITPDDGIRNICKEYLGSNKRPENVIEPGQQLPCCYSNDFGSNEVHYDINVFAQFCLVHISHEFQADRPVQSGILKFKTEKKSSFYVCEFVVVIGGNERRGKITKNKEESIVDKSDEGSMLEFKIGAVPKGEIVKVDLTYCTLLKHTMFDSKELKDKRRRRIAPNKDCCGIVFSIPCYYESVCLPEKATMSCKFCHPFDEDFCVFNKDPYIENVNGVIKPPDMKLDFKNDNQCIVVRKLMDVNYYIPFGDDCAYVDFFKSSIHNPIKTLYVVNNLPKDIEIQKFVDTKMGELGNLYEICNVYSNNGVKFETIDLSSMKGGTLKINTTDNLRATIEKIEERLETVKRVIIFTESSNPTIKKGSNIKYGYYRIVDNDNDNNNNSICESINYDQVAQVIFDEFCKFQEPQFTLIGIDRKKKGEGEGRVEDLSDDTIFVTSEGKKIGFDRIEVIDKRVKVTFAGQEKRVNEGNLLFFMSCEKIIRALSYFDGADIQELIAISNDSGVLSKPTYYTF